MRIARLGVLVIALMAAVTAGRADASTITHQFSTTVTSVDPTAAAYPPSLAGLVVGDPITGTLTYDPASAPVANPFLGIFGDATLYTLGSASFSVNVNGTIFNWTGPLSAFVWDNDNLPSGVRVGVIFSNPFSAASEPLFQLGILGLSPSIFSSEALPTNFVFNSIFQLGQFGSGFEPWLVSGPFSLTQADPAAVPEPASFLLLGTGLTLLATRWRRSRLF
jgi:PEP-CTERM motif